MTSIPTRLSSPHRITSASLRAAGTVAVLGFITMTAHAAPLQNGQFDQGLTGWQTWGDAAVRSGALWGLDIGAAPRLVLGTATTFTDDDAPQAAGAYNASGIDPLIAGDASGLEASLGLSTSAFGLNAYEGSAASQTFDVHAGDRISFTWRLMTRDNGTRGTEPDAAWLIVDQGAQPLLLGDVGTIGMQSHGDAWLASSEITHTFIAQHDGPLSLAWAISDINGFGNTSLLLIGNVAVSAVPEPSALALVLAGALAGISASRRGLCASRHGRDNLQVNPAA